MKDIEKIKTLRLFKRRLGPRNLEARSHADPRRTPRKRINRCMSKEHSVHSECCRRSYYRADVRGIYNIHQNSNALLIFAEFFNRYLRSSPERHPKAAHQSVARKLRYDIARCNIDGHRYEFFLAAVLFDAFENRTCFSFQPLFLN